MNIICTVLLYGGRSGSSRDTKSGFEYFMEEYWFVPVLIIVFTVLTVIGCIYLTRRENPPEPKMISIHLFGMEDICVQRGERIMLPIPEKDGFDFRGWFLDSACTVPYTSTKPVKNELFLYPKWERVAR